MGKSPVKGNSENHNITPLNPSRIPGLMFLCKRERYKKMHKDNRTKKREMISKFRDR